MVDASGDNHFRLNSQSPIAAAASPASFLNTPLKGAVLRLLPLKDPRLFHLFIAFVPLALCAPWIRAAVFSHFWQRMSSRELLHPSRRRDRGSKSLAGMVFKCLCPARDHAIFRACEASNGMEAVRGVLQRDAGAVSEERKEDLATPLHVAAMLQDSDLVRLLLSSQADPLAEDINGRTPLHVAALSGNVEVVGLVMEGMGEGRAMDGVTESGHTALFLACWRGHFEVAQMLQARGANENVVDKEGKSMIDRARGWNQTRVVEWLSSLREKTLAPPPVHTNLHTASPVVEADVPAADLHLVGGDAEEAGGAWASMED